jgi:DNA-binding NtrC family response regulator
MATHILIIEDDTDQRVEIVEYLLRRHHRVTACGSVSEADLALDGATPDAVVADIQLPDGDGLSFFIDNVKRMPDAKWILISGNHDLIKMANDLEARIDLPSCSVMDKPVALRLLGRFIEEHSAAADVKGKST